MGRILPILLSIIMEAKDQKDRPVSPAAKSRLDAYRAQVVSISVPISRLTRKRILAYTSALERILKDLQRILHVTTSKRRRHKIQTFLRGKSIAVKLRELEEEFEWATRDFEVGVSHVARSKS